MSEAFDLGSARSLEAKEVLQEAAEVLSEKVIDHALAKALDAKPNLLTLDFLRLEQLSAGMLNHQQSKARIQRRSGPIFPCARPVPLATFDGAYLPESVLDAVPMRLVEETIERLGLDDPQCRELRARWYQDYLEHSLPSMYLKSKSPFVWAEANRQGLL